MHCFVHQNGRQRGDARSGAAAARSGTTCFSSTAVSTSPTAVRRSRTSSSATGWRRAGRKLVLDPELHVKHLKRWTFWGLVKIGHHRPRHSVDRADPARPAHAERSQPAAQPAGQRRAGVRPARAVDLRGGPLGRYVPRRRCSPCSSCSVALLARVGFTQRFADRRDLGRPHHDRHRFAGGRERHVGARAAAGTRLHGALPAPPLRVPSRLARPPSHEPVLRRLLRPGDAADDGALPEGSGGVRLLRRGRRDHRTEQPVLPLPRGEARPAVRPGGDPVPPAVPPVQWLQLRLRPSSIPARPRRRPGLTGPRARPDRPRPAQRAATTLVAARWLIHPDRICEIETCAPVEA